MKKTAAFNPAVLVVPRNEAVSAERKMSETTQPVEPMSMKVRRPKRSINKAVHTLPTMVKVVQQALRSRGIEPFKPRLP